MNRKTQEWEVLDGSAGVGAREAARNLYQSRRNFYWLNSAK
jgi:hypothetical protein